MIGIKQISFYIPEQKKDNLAYQEKFNFDQSFLNNKLGVEKVAVAEVHENAWQMCLKAFINLQNNYELEPSEVHVIIVVTQNPGNNIPHVSAKLHGEIGAPTSCACFDISLGCSGYVYGLTIVKALMEAQNYKNGLLFTADPYSKIIDVDDKNTALLFGDAASVTLLSHEPVLAIGASSANTLGSSFHELETRNGKLHMNGRAVFNFCSRQVPKDILQTINMNELKLEDIDLFILHQGSKFIVDTIRTSLGLAPEKVPFLANNYGNTVSSSIPIILSDILFEASLKRILISGFGVGLSWSSAMLSRT